MPVEESLAVSTDRQARTLIKTCAEHIQAVRMTLYCSQIISAAYSRVTRSDCEPAIGSWHLLCLCACKHVKLTLTELSEAHRISTVAAWRTAEVS